MKVWTYDSMQLTELANEIKELVLQQIGKPELSEEYAIIHTEPNMLGRLWDKARGKSADKFYFEWVRQVRPKSEEGA